MEVCLNLLALALPWVDLLSHYNPLDGHYKQISLSLVHLTHTDIAACMMHIQNTLTTVRSVPHGVRHGVTFIRLGVTFGVTFVLFWCDLCTPWCDLGIVFDSHHTHTNKKPTLQQPLVSSVGARQADETHKPQVTPSIIHMSVVQRNRSTWLSHQKINSSVADHTCSHVCWLSQNM